MAESEATNEATTEEVVTDDGKDTGTSIGYLDGKYKSVTELENGYKELQSSYTKKTQEYKETMGAFSGAPEQYELEDGLTVDENLINWAKEHKFTNEALNDFVKLQTEMQQKQLEEYTQSEVKKLGKNAKERIKNASDWARANLGEQFAEALNNQFVGAMSIEAIEKMMQISKNPMPTTQKTNTLIDKEKLDFMQFQEKDAHGERKYVSDPAFRKKVLELRESLL